MKNVTIPKTINPDIDNERKSASLNAEEFAIWFYGGKDNLETKRLMEKDIFVNFGDLLDPEYLSYEEMLSVSVQYAVDACKKFRNIQNSSIPDLFPNLMFSPMGWTIMPAGNPFLVHSLMFACTLRDHGTPEQYEIFGRRANNYEIIGTYAQTELGHGTYLRGLETRADYNRKTEEFILNTPTLTSYKWWPGGLGHCSNYCIVVAQLYIDGISKGIQMFLLQVRDEDTYMPLPGIHIGDIGKKLGGNGVNNGFLGLKNVRVPRVNMLMKNQQVLPNGEFVASPISKLSYLPMVYVRCVVCSTNSFLIAAAATIATRYSVVRRQSPIEAQESEPKILDHLTQQMKVIPEIATAVAYRLASINLMRLYEQTFQDITEQDFSRLSELHALSCTLKVFSSYGAAYGIERLRQSCGGHGFLIAANIEKFGIAATASCTYEGENSVLYLQVGKILIKSWSDVLTGKQLMPTFLYLSECANWNSFPEWVGDWNCLIKAFQFACVKTTRIAYKKCIARLQQGLSQPVALNNTSLQLIKAAELHGCAFVAKSFYDEVVHGKNKDQRSPEFQNVLENLLELYLIQMFFRQSGDILRFILLSDKDMDSLQVRLEEALKILRPNAVSIVDGFDFHDCSLNSVLGSYDGNVYERLFHSALKNPVNKASVPKFFDLYLKPFMQENAQSAANSKL